MAESKDTPDVAGIAERLKEEARDWRDDGVLDLADLLDEAAQSLASKDAEIERLTKELGEARYELLLHKMSNKTPVSDHQMRRLLKDADLSLTARIADLEKALAEAREDKARLDFLDACNARLNAHYGTTYRWQMVMNHNVTRLMLGHMVVDLNDADGSNRALPSCREAIDAARLARQGAKP